MLLRRHAGRQAAPIGENPNLVAKGEQGTAEHVLGNPQDAYTRELLTAIPHPPLPVA